MVDFVLNSMSEAFEHIIAAPFVKPEIWWYLAPIILLWFLLESRKIFIKIYFGHYKTESMGWDTALGNGFSFLWINIEAMRALFEQGLNPFFLRFIVLIMTISYGFLIIYLSFKHRIRQDILGKMSSPTALYYFSGIIILWAHGPLKLSLWVVIDLVLVFVVLLLSLKVLRNYLSKKSYADEHNYRKFGFKNLPIVGSSKIKRKKTTSGLSPAKKAPGPLKDFKFPFSEMVKK